MEEDQITDVRIIDGTASASTRQAFSRFTQDFAYIRYGNNAFQILLIAPSSCLSWA